MRLEDFDFATHCELARFFGVEPRLQPQRYHALAENRPESLSPRRSTRDWSEQEVREFESEVARLTERLGYEWRVATLRESLPAGPPARRPATGGAAARLRGLARRVAKRLRRG